MKIHIIPTLSDNYTYVLEGHQKCAILDPGEAPPVIKFLEENNLKPDLIINTHHHGDHTGGNAELKNKYGCKIAAPANETGKIGFVDIPLKENGCFDICGEPAQILETPGHTLGHICLYLPASKALFSADTLFSMGCGRLFEGSAEQMWDSFQKIIALPDDTKIYPGHEYTLANAKFCLKIEPENANLQARYKEVENLRDQNKPTIPVTLSQEKNTNVFLRAGSAEKFADLRRQKDNA